MGRDVGVKSCGRIIMEVNMVDGSVCVCVCVEQYRGKRYRYGGGDGALQMYPVGVIPPLG